MYKAVKVEKLVFVFVEEVGVGCGVDSCDVVCSG